MKKIAAGIAATLAAAGADAQEERRRLAPPAVYEVAPGLGHFTDDVLFGEFWKRTELAPRDRSMVTVTVLVSTGKSAQIGSHVRRALDNGVRPEEIGEILTHLAFYSGWPNAISAVAEVKKVFDERKIGDVTNSEKARVELEQASEAARLSSVEAGVAPTAPALADLTNRVLFGDLWKRPDLAPRDRSLVTMAALVAIGQPEQLPFHANRAMDNGLTQAEAAEVVTHIGFYAGWPRAISAVPVLKSVFEGRQAAAPRNAEGIKVVRAGTSPTPGPADYFTGNVTVSAPYKGDGSARIGGATVSFEAGARTAWHTHPLGQTLFIISGTALIQKEGGPVETANPGDLVWIPPLVKHWHGATPDSPMAHLAVSEALNGTTVTWLEKVSDEQYPSRPAPRN